MNEQHEAKFYIRDTVSGQIQLSDQPFADLGDEPVQIMVISGSNNASIPQAIMSRREFAEWRMELEDQGYFIELRFVDDECDRK